jgi:hypothetical protein
VQQPIIRFSVMIKPNCTGSIPSLSMIGSSTGTRMVMAATTSTKQATNRTRRLASSRNSHCWK